MRTALSLAIFVLVCFSLASAQTTNPSGTSAAMQKASLSPGETIVTGGLQGKTDDYYLSEKDGRMRLLIGPNAELEQHVDHWVQLGGNRDLRRDACASSDEGTPHGLRFFQVEEILADQGTCKR